MPDQGVRRRGNVIWLGGQVIALHSVLIAEVWRWIPFATIFLLAGLQIVPQDGARSGCHRRSRLMAYLPLRHVPSDASGGRPRRDLPVRLGHEGVRHHLRADPRRPEPRYPTLNFLVYRQSFEQFDFGSAAATAYLLSALTVLVIRRVGMDAVPDAADGTGVDMAGRSGSRRKQIVTYGLAGLVLVVMAFPLYGIALTSIQTERDIRSRDVAFAPAYVTTEHYRQILSEDSGVPVAESMVNSLIVAVASSVLTVAIASPPPTR